MWGKRNEPAFATRHAKEGKNRGEPVDPREKKRDGGNEASDGLPVGEIS